MRLAKTIITVLLLAILVIVANENLVTASTKNLKASDGKKCTIIGTKGNDTLKGTSKSDVICGLGGNDKIQGLGGNDTIDGGSGDDSIVAGSGDDKLYGGTGNDTLKGESGSDYFKGNEGIDTVSYSDKKKDLNISLNNKKDDGEKNEKDLISSDVENLTGGTGNDKIQGNDRKNTLIGLAGNDKIEGNKGNDEIVGKEGSDTLKGNQGDDHIDGGQGSNTCYLDQEDSESSSCQLLKDLGDLVVHVKGTIHNSDLKGCYFFMNSPIGEEPAASGLIDKNGHFELDAFTGKYLNWQVGKLFESGYTDYPGKNPDCASNVSLSGNMYNLEIIKNMPEFSITLPDVIEATISVKNAAGKRVAGLNSSYITGGQSRIPSSWDKESYYNLSIPPFTTQANQDQKVQVLEGDDYDIRLSGKIYGMKISREFEGKWSKKVNLIIQ